MKRRRSEEERSALALTSVDGGSHKPTAGRKHAEIAAQATRRRYVAMRPARCPCTMARAGPTGARRQRTLRRARAFWRAAGLSAARRACTPQQPGPTRMWWLRPTRAGPLSVRLVRPPVATFARSRRRAMHAPCHFPGSGNFCGSGRRLLGRGRGRAHAKEG